jgi:hypothetical protein
MSDDLTVEFKVHFGNGKHGKRKLRQGARKEVPKPGRVPRVARLMALALHYDDLIRSGHVRDYADLARLGHVTRARMTQIMNLLNLAPDIQEAILLLPTTEHGCDAVAERHLRPITLVPNWQKQRRMWREIHSSVNSRQ